MSDDEDRRNAYARALNVGTTQSMFAGFDAMELSRQLSQTASASGKVADAMKRASGGYRGLVETLGGGPVKPTVRTPADRSWGLLLWDGLAKSTQIDLRGLNAMFGEADGGNVKLVISGTVSNDPALVASLRAMFGTGAPMDTAEVAAMSRSAALPLSDALLPIRGALSGDWIIVAGEDVRVVPRGECPVTHLPVFSLWTRGAAEALADLVAPTGRAPETVTGATVAGTLALSDLCERVCGGAPAPGLDARQRAARAFLAPPRPPAGVPPAGTTEAALLASGRVRSVVSPDDYIQWAVDTGRVLFERLHAPAFGAERAVVYPDGTFALLYPDHVRLGVYCQSTTASSPTRPASTATNHDPSSE